MQIQLNINISRPRWTRNWSTRRKVMVFLALALALPPAAFVAANDIFSDVPNDHMFHDEISAISGARITTGTTPTTFSPEDLPTRGQIAAFLHRGLERVAYNRTPSSVTLNGFETLAVVTIKTGGAPGGTGFVKLDATVNAQNTGTTGCPCEVQFWIQHGDSPTVDLTGEETIDNAQGGVWSQINGSLTWVVPVPTASTQTFTLTAIKNNGTATVTSTGSLSAVYIPFGAAGGNTLDPPAMAPLAVSEAQESKAETNKSNK